MLAIFTCRRRKGKQRGSTQGQVREEEPRDRAERHSHFLRCAKTSCSAHEVLLSCRRKCKIWLLLAMMLAVITTLQGHCTL